MKIAFFELEDWEKEHIKKRLKGHHLLFFETTLDQTQKEKYKDAEIIGVFIYSHIDEKALANLKKTRFIATMSTGFDHIDLLACKKRNIAVSNVPTYGANTVAEHTFALILNLTRKIHKAWDRTRQLNFSIDGLRGIDLQGKTLGVVGVGNIGQHVIRIAKGFEMKVVAYDAYKSNGLAKDLGFSYVPFDAMLRKSDIITLHCPYNKETHHLINASTIKKMKKGCILINTARGGLIDTNALLRALDLGTIAACGLDVLEEECYVHEEKEVMTKSYMKKCDLRILLENHALAKRENVIITPHNAFNSVEALKRILDTTCDNIEAFAKKKPINRVV